MIKSRMLLPDIEQSDADEEDPREELVEKLIEYQNFKAYASLLDSKKRSTSAFIYENAV